AWPATYRHAAGRASRALARARRSQEGTAGACRYHHTAQVRSTLADIDTCAHDESKAAAVGMAHHAAVSPLRRFQALRLEQAWGFGSEKSQQRRRAARLLRRRQYAA